MTGKQQLSGGVGDFEYFGDDVEEFSFWKRKRRHARRSPNRYHRKPSNAIINT